MSSQLEGQTPKPSSSGRPAHHGRASSTGALVRPGSGYAAGAASLAPGGEAERGLRPRPGHRRARSREGEPMPRPEDGRLLDLTLAELVHHARARADWHRTVPEHERAPLGLLLEIASFSAAILGACGDFRARDLWSAIGRGDRLDPSGVRALDAYARGVQWNTVCVEPVATVERACFFGARIVLLEDGLGVEPQRLASMIDPPVFMAAASAGVVPGFIEHMRERMADGVGTLGHELKSYLGLVAEDGMDPTTLEPEVHARVKNPHRLSRAVLERVAADLPSLHDEADDRPIVLVVIAGDDHNGAFHRDPGLDHMITRLPGRFRLALIEGQGTLSDARAYIATLPDDKVTQVILAGHGEARSINLGGGRSGDDLDFQHNQGDSEALIETLSAKLDRDARVVLSACLTNTYDAEIDPSMPHEMVVGRMRLVLAMSPPLTRELQMRLSSKAATVIGANAQTTPTSRIWDEDNERVDLLDPLQPDIGGSAEAYARTGAELDGVWRSLMTVWAEDDASHTDFRSVITERVRERPGVGDADGRLLDLQCQIIERERLWESFELLAQLRSLATAIDELRRPSRRPARAVATRVRDEPLWVDEHVELARAEAAVSANRRLAFANAFAHRDPAEVDVLIEAAEACRLPMVSYIADLSPDLVPMEAVLARGPKPGVIVLAAVVMFEDQWAALRPACADFFVGLLEGDRFPARLGIARYLGGHSEVDLFERVRARRGVGRQPNLGTDGAPQANVSLRPMHQRGVAQSDAELVRYAFGPPTGEALDEGAVVFILGEVDGFYAIAWGDGVRFVAYEALVTASDGARRRV